MFINYSIKFNNYLVKDVDKDPLKHLLLYQKSILLSLNLATKEGSDFLSKTSRQSRLE